MSFLRRGWVQIWAAILASPGSKAAAALSLLAGLGVGLVPEQHIYTYLWRDPAFCGDCHVHDYANEAYERSVHAGLTTCHDCHQVPIRHYPRNLWMMLVDRPQTPEDIPHPEIATTTCTRCHSREADQEPLTGPMPESLRARVVKIDDSPLHRAHLSSEARLPTEAHGGTHDATARAAVRTLPAADLHNAPSSWDRGVITCTDCHGSTDHRAHRFTATRDDCVTCHTTTEQHGRGLASADCRACHLTGFLGQDFRQPERGETVHGHDVETP